MVAERQMAERLKYGVNSAPLSGSYRVLQPRYRASISSAKSFATTFRFSFSEGVM